MDALVASFHRVHVDYVNDSPFGLEVREGAVFAREHIPCASCIGELHGTPCYVWDISHAEYILIEEDLVLDLCGMQRTALTFLREENETNNVANCRIDVETCPQTGTNRFFVTAVRHIHPGNELVYSTMHLQ